MASISTDSNGNRRILFVLPDNARKQIRLGKSSMQDCETIRGRINQILEAAGLHVPMHADTVRWITDIPDKLHEKLAKNGLVPSRQPVATRETVCVAAFIDRYIALRGDVKPNTLRTWRQTRALLVEHYGEARTIEGLSPLDARGFHAWLSSATKPKTTKRRFSGASVSKYVSFARQFFSAAVDAQIIPANPFQGIKVGRRSNKARQRFIDRETIDRVLAGCADPEFKLVIALSRFGGLRIPSELDGLLWPHIDRARGRILVTSPKTERYEGGATREIPLFPELVPFIDAWWDACPEKSEHVIISNRRTEAAWRARLGKLLGRLGIPAWPRVFHNLRASRQTELESRFPSHVVCQWLGNSEAVAREHYLQTIDDDYRAAAASPADAPPEKAAQNPAQIATEREGNRGKRILENAKTPEKSRVLRSLSGADGNRTHLAPLQTPHRV